VLGRHIVALLTAAAHPEKAEPAKTPDAIP